MHLWVTSVTTNPCRWGSVHTALCPHGSSDLQETESIKIKLCSPDPPAPQDWLMASLMQQERSRSMNPLHTALCLPLQTNTAALSAGWTCTLRLIVAECTKWPPRAQWHIIIISSSSSVLFADWYCWLGAGYVSDGVQAAAFTSKGL